LSAFVALLLIDLHFPDAGSLKAKRRDLQSIKAQLHGRLGMTVAEVGHQDLWQRSALAAAVTGGSPAAVDQAVDRVERYLDERLPQGYAMRRTTVSFEDVL